MTLGAQRRLFSGLISELVLWIKQQPGYDCQFEQVLRTQLEADANAASGAGIKNSLHIQGLAADLSIFKDGRYPCTLEELKPIGDKWTSMHPLARWGGNWKKVDSDHFSLEWQGIQ